MASPRSPSGKKMTVDPFNAVALSTNYGDNFTPFAFSTPPSSPNGSFLPNPDACSSPPGAFQFMDSISSISSLSNNSFLDTSNSFAEEDSPPQCSSSPTFDELFEMNEDVPSGQPLYWKRKQGKGAGELSTIFEEVTQENSKLREQLEDTMRKLNISKMQIKVLLDLEETFPEEFNKTKSQNEMDGNITFTESKETQVEVCNEEEEQRLVAKTSSSSRLLPIPEHTFIFIREITSRIEVYQVRERVVEGLQISNQFVIGGAVGWLGAYLIKNFGKPALIAAGGGLLVLTFATKKGLVEVNWNNVLHEVQKVSGDSQLLYSSQNSLGPTASMSNLSITESPNSSWAADKITGVKNWVSENSVAVVGFATGFLYTAYYT